jgi:hypothetical protein
MSIVPSYQADIVFILPFFLLRYLHISRRQFWGLVSIFSLGGIAITISIARVVVLAFSATITEVAVWTALECSVAIIVACCPALRLLFRRPPRSETDSSVEKENVHHRHGRGRNNVNPKRMDYESSLYEGSITDTELVAGANGRFIFKHVDFEIKSERGSKTAQTIKLRSESWEHLDSKFARI